MACVPSPGLPFTPPLSPPPPPHLPFSLQVSRSEAEFLIGETPFVRRRAASVRYAAESLVSLRAEREEGEGEGVYHYTTEDIEPLWHDGMELLLITHGTMQVSLRGY